MKLNQMSFEDRYHDFLEKRIKNATSSPINPDFDYEYFRDIPTREILEFLIRFRHLFNVVQSTKRNITALLYKVMREKRREDRIDDIISE